MLARVAEHLAELLDAVPLRRNRKNGDLQIALPGRHARETLIGEVRDPLTSRRVAAFGSAPATNSFSKRESLGSGW